MDTYVFKSAFSPRRNPDPINPGIEHYTMLCEAGSIPRDLPLDANAREPNIDRAKYRQIRESLWGADGSVVPFHHKNKGITILGDAAVKHNDELHVSIPEGFGVTDGGHTLHLVYEAQGSDEADLSNVYVPITVRVGAHEDWVPEISGGLNTALQVKDMSLDNLKGRFEWLKESLKGESFYDQIAWRENDDGKIDARDVISIINLFNVDRWLPDSGEHPVESYSSKGAVLKRFEEHPGQFEMLKPIITDIFTLHDIVRYDSRDPWNASKGKYRSLSIVESRQRGKFEAVFTDKTSVDRLTSAAVLPILAAFRVFVSTDSGDVEWEGGFDHVQQAFNETIVELMNTVYGQFVELGRNPNKLGKSKPVWDQCYQRVRIWSLLNKSS